MEIFRANYLKKKRKKKLLLINAYKFRSLSTLRDCFSSTKQNFFNLFNIINITAFILDLKVSLMSSESNKNDLFAEVQNVVASVDLRCKIKLERAASRLPGDVQVSYIPEQFPGVVVKIKKPKVFIPFVISTISKLKSLYIS